MVKMKLMEPVPEGQGWTQVQADQAELWYKRFLHVCLTHPKLSSVPNRPIDLIWHQHILDTRAYAKDCKAIFGSFLHHFPYFGINGAEDAANRDRAFDHTNAVYETLFGENCKQMTAFHKKARREAENCLVSLQGNDGSQVAVGEDCGGNACTGAVCNSACMVDGVIPDPTGKRVSCHPDMVASNCNHSGSGTGCGQGGRGG